MTTGKDRVEDFTVNWTLEVVALAVAGVDSAMARA
jgi:hypothetical protein